MSTLRTLIVEDCATDAELLIKHLRGTGYDVRAHVVETEADYRAALALAPAPDIILSDYRLPQFDGLRALELLLELRLDIPFILVSGTIAEEIAIDAIRRGADDYLLKDRLSRLETAVTHALERRKSRAAIAERKRQLETLISNLPGVVYRCSNDADYTTDFVSNSIQELTGYPAEDFRQGRRQIGEMIHPDDRQRTWADIQTATESGRPFAITYRLVTAAGEVKWLWDSGRGIRDANGRLQALEGFVTDITDRKTAEAARHVMEQRLLLATRSSNVGLWDWNIADGQVWLSPEWKQQLGYRDEEICDSFVEWANRLHPQDEDRVLGTLDASLKKPWPRFQTEMRLRHKDDSYRWIYAEAELIRNDDDKPLRMLGCHLDITARKHAEQRLRDSEMRYRQLVEDAADGIVVYDKDKKFVFANPRSCELFGYGEHELLGIGIEITDYEGEQENLARRVQAATEGQILRYERLVRRKDGSAFPAEISLKQLDNGQFQAIFHDITNRRAQEQKIARLTRLHRARSGISTAIIRIHDRRTLLQEICRIAVEQGGFNFGWIGMLDATGTKLREIAQAGLPVDDSADRGIPEGAVERDLTGFSAIALRENRPAFDNAVDSGCDETVIRQLAIRTGQESVIALPLVMEGMPAGILSLYAPDRDHFDDEEVNLLTGLAEDISLGLEFIGRDEKLSYLSNYDPLTGLPNRSLFFERLTADLATGACEGRSVALLLVDLDRFRMINDTLGRMAGDMLINAVAHRIQDAFTGYGVVARVGADSFAIVVSGDWQMQDAARAIESRIQDLFDRPFLVGDEELRVTVTAGAAVFPSDANEPGMLFANAEAALRNATSQNVPLRFYSAEMNARVAESLRLETRLRYALENDELVLWYQPKTDTRTGKLMGFEALMRWQDPESGLVPPAKFIPLMEETGLILDAGRWALSQVARDCRRWVESGIQPLRVAVNVSPQQLRQIAFLDTVVEAAAQAEAAGATLGLEITESAIMEDVDAVIARLKTISGLGVEISIDDFGTGYSSLAYIARLPIHALKIDRSFVVGMPEMNGSLAIVSSVISLAHSLQLQVVAEVVETEEQSAMLARLGCDQLQGYLISRPMPPEAVPEFMRQWQGFGAIDRPACPP
jgi:diguanylate cyclase (GGDEF)-like protein/PAS domain S-box-containing protein